jgi:hypothetical protein
VPPGTRCSKIILNKRKKAYPHRKKANPGFLKKFGVRTPLRSGRNSDRIDDAGGLGFETAKEVNACPKCVKCHEEVNPE